MSVYTLHVLKDHCEKCPIQLRCLIPQLVLLKNICANQGNKWFRLNTEKQNCAGSIILLTSSITKLISFKSHATKSTLCVIPLNLGKKNQWRMQHSTEIPWNSVGSVVYMVEDGGHKWLTLNTESEHCTQGIILFASRIMKLMKFDITCWEDRCMCNTL